MKQLNEADLEIVNGGTMEEFPPDYHKEEPGACTCPMCGRSVTKITHNSSVWGQCEMCGHFDV